ncbi:MAG: TIM barrel protein [Desulfobacterales bacterium]|jgi:sugar phosphate isomerase/epimerase
METFDNKYSETPRLAMCNFITDMARLKRFAVDHGFGGIDWSFDLENMPTRPADESRWVDFLAALDPLEIRFHCPFAKIDIGHEDPQKGRVAVDLFYRVIKLVAKADGKFLTLHVGLGRDSTKTLSWNDTLQNLRRMVQYGAERGVTVCLENLAWGWTSKPNLFEKLVRRSGAGVTFDIGHAHACESVGSQHFDAEDFVSPHPNRVFNAHIYYSEIPGVGHLPVKHLDDIRDRLHILRRTGCRWWVIEIRDVEGLLQTKEIIDAYLEQDQPEGPSGENR